MRDNKEIYQKFPSCILYLNDVEKLVKVFKEFSNKFIIIVRDQEIKNINELNDLKENYITNLCIKSADLNIHLKFKSNKIEFYAAEDNKKNRDLLKQVWNILNTKRRKFYFLHNIPGHLILLILIFSFYYLSVKLIDIESLFLDLMFKFGILFSAKLLIGFISILLLLFFLFIYWLVRVDYFTYSIIYTNYNFIKVRWSNRKTRILNSFVLTLTFLVIAISVIFTGISVRQQKIYNINSIRPWIEFQPHNEIIIKENGVDLSYTIKNYGKSPALKFTSGIKFFLNSELPGILFYPRKFIGDVSSDIFPDTEQPVPSHNKKIEGFTKPYNKEEIKKLIMEKRLYLISYFKYEDISGQLFYNLNLLLPVFKKDTPTRIICGWANINASHTKKLEIPASSRE